MRVEQFRLPLYPESLGPFQRLLVLQAVACEEEVKKLPAAFSSIRNIEIQAPPTGRKLSFS
jgi:hypothetical protein